MPSIYPLVLIGLLALSAADQPRLESDDGSHPGRATRSEPDEVPETQSPPADTQNRAEADLPDEMPIIPRQARSAPARSRPARSGLVEFPETALKSVRDYARGFLDEEYDAYYQLLAHARDTDRALQQAAAGRLVAEAETAFRADPENRRVKFSVFGDMVRNPSRYRGRPVTLRGYIQRLESMPAGENDEGLQTLYQVYLFTGDSLQNPYVVVTSSIPSDVPIPKKGSPTNDIVVTGYFFKLWSYEAERGRWAAPLILASELEWHPRPTPFGSRFEFKVGVVVGIVGIVLTIALALIRQRRNDRRFRQLHAARDLPSAADDLEALRHLEGDH